MKTKSHGGFILLISFSSLVFAALGNIFGNVVADLAPTILTMYAIQSLIGVSVLLFLITFFLESDASDLRKHISRIRQVFTIAMILLAECLSPLEGILTNIVAAQLPSHLKSQALPFFLIAIGIVICIAVGLSLKERSLIVKKTDRPRFLSRMQNLYDQQELDALRRGALIPLAFEGMLQTIHTDDTPYRQPFPDGMTIEQIYDSANEHLLVVGEPGAGKTTILNELAIMLTKRANNSEEHPIPVIFNLSTWAIQQMPLEQWMVNDLTISYQMKRTLALAWMTNHKILPLLDGLDEVDDDHRKDCVLAINTFYEKHLDLPLVVCSRIAEYGDLAVALTIPTKILVRSLTDEQIMNYLTQGSDTLATFRAAVEKDAALRDVLRTPLMLSMATQTYEHLPQSAIPPVTNRIAWRQQLLSDYVKRMLERKREGEHEASYSNEKVQRYLAWLANQMQSHRLVIFQMEHLQPDWVQKPWMVYLINMLIGGLCFGAVFAFADRVIVGLITGLITGLVVGIIAILILDTRATWFNSFMIISVLLIGTISGVVVGTDIGLNGRIIGGIVVGGTFPGIFGIITDTLHPHDANRSVPQTTNKDARRFIQSGLVIGIAAGVIDGFAVSFSKGPIYGLTSGLVAGLAFGLIDGFDIVISYFNIRTILIFEHAIPLNYHKFLQYVSHHILLHRIGDGYRFVHILLSDFFMLSIDPQDVATWNDRGNMLCKIERYEEAIACYDQALAIDPTEAIYWRNKGLALYDLKRNEEAIACYDKALSIDPNSANAWSNKGLALDDLKRYEEAIACYDKALAIDPKDANARYNKGVALNALKRYEEAIACYAQAIAIDPKDANAWNNKGVALGTLKHHEEAIACYDQALSIDPNFAYSVVSRGTTLAFMGQYGAIDCRTSALTHQSSLLTGPSAVAPTTYTVLAVGSF